MRGSSDVATTHCDACCRLHIDYSLPAIQKAIRWYGWYSHLVTAGSTDCQGGPSSNAIHECFLHAIWTCNALAVQELGVTEFCQQTRYQTVQLQYSTYPR